MKTYLVIDRNNGCRPAKNPDGNTKTVQGIWYIDALAKANPDFEGDNLDLAPFNVVEEDYLRECLKSIDKTGPETSAFSVLY